MACSNLWVTLVSILFQIPTTEWLWVEIADGFSVVWNFPQYVDAMDGKHVEIQTPENSGNTHIMISADIDCQGKISDGVLFKYKCL